MPFLCSICEEAATQICARCTKDACSNHICERCLRCSDCCECEVALTEPVRPEAHAANGNGAPEPDFSPPESEPAPPEETDPAIIVP